MQKPSPILVVLLAALAVSVGYNVFAGLTTQRTFTSVGQIATVDVDVYSDLNLTVRLTTVDWGIVEPGQTVTRRAYVKSESNVPLTLTLNVTSWDPVEAAAFIAVSWDAEGWILPAGNYVGVTFTLAVDPSVQNIRQFTSLMTIKGVSA